MHSEQQAQNSNFVANMDKTTDVTNLDDTSKASKASTLWSNTLVLPERCKDVVQLLGKLWVGSLKMLDALARRGDRSLDLLVALLDLLGALNRVVHLAAYHSERRLHGLDVCREAVLYKSTVESEGCCHECNAGRHTQRRCLQASHLAFESTRS